MVSNSNHSRCFFHLSPSQHLYFPKFNFSLYSYQSPHRPDHFSSNVSESLSLMDPWAVKGLLSVCVMAPLSDSYFKWIAAGRVIVCVCELCEWVYVSSWMYDSACVCHSAVTVRGPSTKPLKNWTSPKNTNGSFTFCILFMRLLGYVLIFLL